MVFGESDPIGEDEGTLKSGLIRGVVFGESDPIGEDEGTLKSGLIRGVVFGESDPIGEDYSNSTCICKKMFFYKLRSFFSTNLKKLYFFLIFQNHPYFNFDLTLKNMPYTTIWFFSP